MKHYRSMSIFWTLLLLLAVARVGVTEGSEINGNTVKETIRNLEHADAKKDLKKALKKGDKRFIGVMGYGLWVPGLDGEGSVSRSEYYRKKYGVQAVEGTSDNMRNQDIENLNVLAEKYARQYNKLLLEYLESLEKGMPSH